jgi:hypothetical protein
MPTDRIERINKRQIEVLEKRRNEQKLRTKRKKENFAIGDFVLYRNIQRKGKLEPRLIGPFVVIKVSKVGCCKIKDLKNEKIVLVHWNNLKPVYSNEEHEIDKALAVNDQEDLKQDLVSGNVKYRSVCQWALLVSLFDTLYHNCTVIYIFVCLYLYCIFWNPWICTGRKREART